MAPVARMEGTFDIGDGHAEIIGALEPLLELYIRCIGSGSPTILLEAGDGDPGTNHWRFVAGDLDPETRTCVYDRLGLGRSGAATDCRQVDDILDDLDALLAAAAIEGPYVLDGASGGDFPVTSSRKSIAVLTAARA